jgi:hypothetical protein
VGGAAALFYAPALEHAGGGWPVPLDDTFIYFGFARTLALGEPFAWAPGNGYSSGATSVLYPALLAPGWALGLRGALLGAWAALIAYVCLFDLCRSLAPLAGRGAPARWLVPLFVVGVPLLDWSFFSGMETALAAALVGRALASVDRARRAEPHLRARAQLAAGGWIALLPLGRPELVVLGLALGVSVAHGARAHSAARALGRSVGPLAAALGTLGCANAAFTGELAPAGAIRKLLTHAPEATELGVALAWLVNASVLVAQGIERALGGAPGLGALALLAVAALAGTRTRALALPLLVGAAGALALACLNAAARYQNYRYAAPALVMLTAVASLGSGTIAGARRAWRGALALVPAVALLGATSRELGGQRRHFARASRNIAEQHGEVARRLRALEPPPRRVLVGDAGAIPYLAEVPAVDGLGLGGYRGLPFARASVEGVGAVVELIERLEARERPDLMALYPGWWPGLGDVFGRRIDAVRIADNVICAADEKVIFRADWSLLATAGEPLGAGVVDTLDVGDLVSERTHGFRGASGWVGAATRRSRTGEARWDAGRTLATGTSASWIVAGGVAPGPARLSVRCAVDAYPSARLVVRILRAGREIGRAAIPAPAPDADRWLEPEVALAAAAGGDRIEITAEAGSWHVHHVWLAR